MVDLRRLTLLLICLLVSPPLFAHKLKVFATAEGERILGQAYFVGGAGAGGAEIRITDGDGGELARLQPDEQGNFEYRVARPMTYRVVANSLDGHQAVWTLQAEEFSPALPAAQPEPVADTTEPVTESDATTVHRLPPQAITEASLERAVARQIRPLREALQAYEERVRLRDIIGGIGYIVGLAGLGLWWGRRRKDVR